MLNEILLLLSSGILGIFLGAQIAEAVLFVPYWKALAPEEFFEFHKTYGAKIHKFFAPLTIAATLLPLCTVGYNLILTNNNKVLFLLMGISTIAFFFTYFLYFKKANNGFAERSISNENLPQELVRWGNWHWGRICFEAIAFVCALVLLSKGLV